MTDSRDLTERAAETRGTSPRSEMTTDAPPPPTCPLSKRVDGPWHSWQFDGDDPYVICAFCDERRDSRTGYLVTKGRTQ